MKQADELPETIRSRTDEAVRIAIATHTLENTAEIFQK